MVSKFRPKHAGGKNDYKKTKLAFNLCCGERQAARDSSLIGSRSPTRYCERLGKRAGSRKVIFL